ncbi:hypothetical protein FGE12_23865 [Aggregicoccus sp. 17bor-14]|uniref:hypothetical protein n=1 Tax=Myxococcaceae TaxID=31 RepID=UPI00129C352D|nr:MULTISPECIES: hypothetical protein [Myxococcaceae]MBF5045465.1 hypothetical protein [Simulacricoccus sp. 17bor-14]MRI91203.1 hypothetical protein [Aggregicoccus sp. 17bor-14]
MSRSVDYEVDVQLSELIERLRVGLERHPTAGAALAAEVEQAMALLTARNQRRRVLQRMQAQGLMDGRPEQARLDLEAQDAQLRERLSGLLARLEPRSADEDPQAS